MKTVNKQRQAENSWSAKNVAKVVVATSSEGFLVVTAVGYEPTPPLSEVVVLPPIHGIISSRQ